MTIELERYAQALIDAGYVNGGEQLQAFARKGRADGDLPVSMSFETDTPSLMPIKGGRRPGAKYSVDGAKLKDVRKDMGVSQQKFGEVLGISGKYVSSIERGRDTKLNEKSFHRLFEVTGFPSVYFLLEDQPLQEK
jgi:DNA-binding XRE family transcriptional regulator